MAGRYQTENAKIKRSHFCIKKTTKLDMEKTEGFKNRPSFEKSQKNENECKNPLM
jgi:hypothetical protein